MPKLKKILLIEPDKLLGDILLCAFKEAGFDLTYATNAQDGVSLADEIMPDLVILELQLISHSGIEFMYEFRSYPDWENTPLIIYSSVPPAEFNLSQDCMLEKLNVSKYLYKPSTSITELIRASRELLNSANIKQSKKSHAGA